MATDTTGVTISAKPIPGNSKCGTKAAALLTEVLNACEYPGEWTMTPMHQTQLHNSARLRVVRFTATELVLRIKPGDSSTCWDWMVRPPATMSTFAVGRELTLWNGYDGKNIPDAVKANAEADQQSLDDSSLFIAKIDRLRSTSGEYRKRDAAIGRLRQEVQEAYASVAAMEESLSELEREHAADTDGATATAQFEVIRDLFVR